MKRMNSSGWRDGEEMEMGEKEGEGKRLWGIMTTKHQTIIAQN